MKDDDPFDYKRVCIVVTFCLSGLTVSSQYPKFLKGSRSFLQTLIWVDFRLQDKLFPFHNGTQYRTTFPVLELVPLVGVKVPTVVPSSRSSPSGRIWVT